MIIHALALTFAAWVLVEAEVLTEVRAATVDKATGKLAYFLTCRVCLGFWLSFFWLFDTSTWSTFTVGSVSYFLAVNGAHGLIVNTEALAKTIADHYRRIETDAVVESFIVPSGALAPLVKAWGAENAGEIDGVESFLQTVFDHAPDATISDLHNELKGIE